MFGGLGDLASLTPLGALLLVLVVVFWLISSGRLIPRTTHLELMKSERSRADEWKETAQADEQVINILLGQHDQLIASGRTLTANDHIPIPEETGGRIV